jgi:glycerol-3-phosphate dehydrogenase (NAD(P)+)
MDVAVIGAGSWGTALAKVLAQNGHAVTLWGHTPAHVADIAARRQNTRYLPGVDLPPNLAATDDLGQAVKGRPFVVSVTPSHTVREVMERAAPSLSPDAIVISASKGIENDTLATMDEVLKAVLPGRVGARLAILSGPSFAKEVGLGLPTAVVMASHDREVASGAA